MSSLSDKAAVLALAATIPFAAHAEEGMWTLDNPPLKALQERYGFTPPPGWLDKVRLASVRFNDGGSGAFVSARGLVLTNHHVALGQLQKMSSAERDYVKDGFLARSAAEEIRCPDLELNVLVSYEDVSGRVLGAVDAAAPDKVRNEQRKAEMARVEKESTDKTGLRSDVVELYQGGEYWLYRYKKYTDIRLVMAPEAQAAFYGGDPDNFTFPRFDLDFAFFRAYEDGKPVRPQHWFPWSRAGAQDGELVFVSGHPGSTARLKTLAQLEHQRDLQLPERLKLLERRRKAYYAYSAKGAEQARQAKDRIFSVENSLKALGGELKGLKDAALMSRKASEEAALRARSPEEADAWERIAKVQRELARRHKQIHYRRFFGSKLAEFAGAIVRWTAEVEKPNDKRFAEFRDSALESLRFRLFSPAPVYSGLEEHMLADILRESLEELGPEDEHVKAALGGRTPEEQARRLVGGTKLADPAFRRSLVEGGRAAVEASDDPMIAWARALDASYRELREWYEDGVESVESLEGGRIAKARFKLYGKSAYPDATFTLRLSFGRVAGYDQGTNLVPYKTTFYGLYDRAESFDHKPPFDLPPRLAEARARVDLATPLNFTTTNDIIGGNSGSPVFNKAGEYVGLIFDGNIQGLVLRYAYDERQARAVAVHSRGILEALRGVYRAGPLAEELTSGR